MWKWCWKNQVRSSAMKMQVVTTLCRGGGMRSTECHLRTVLLGCCKLSHLKKVKMSPQNSCMVWPRWPCNSDAVTVFKFWTRVGSWRRTARYGVRASRGVAMRAIAPALSRNYCWRMLHARTCPPRRNRLIHGVIEYSITWVTRWHDKELACWILIHCHLLVMAALRSRCGHHIFCPVISFYLLSFFIHRLISAAADWMSTILAHMVRP